jgi:hypothetical protein
VHPQPQLGAALDSAPGMFPSARADVEADA